MTELLWLLLPIAAASGWFAARKSALKNHQQQIEGFNSAYFKGLNYLLNEQPDKAIEVFVKMAEVDSDTVETHLALGNLFRRRGEVDRAIRIHQNLIARPTLNIEQRSYSLLELAEDYMKAGLLDRAENLFQELVTMNRFAETALTNLLDIYQQEKDWDQSIQIATQLSRDHKAHLSGVIAHHYCELAEKAIEEGRPSEARNLSSEAMAQSSECVRASILLGAQEFRNSEFRAALKCYQGVASQDIEYFPEVITPLLKCYERLNDPQAAIRYLSEIVKDYNGISTVIALAELIRIHDDEHNAVEFMVTQLSKRPSVRGLKWIIERSLGHSEGKAHANLTILDGLISQLLKDKPVYKCKSCGFSGKAMHWHCPSCKQWDTVKPIHGLEGE